jgi:hypothetical protein
MEARTAIASTVTIATYSSGEKLAFKRRGVAFSALSFSSRGTNPIAK